MLLPIMTTPITSSATTMIVTLMPTNDAVAAPMGRSFGPVPLVGRQPAQPR
jgi:hypothetical protein